MTTSLAAADPPRRAFGAKPHQNQPAPYRSRLTDAEVHEPRQLVEPAEEVGKGELRASSKVVGLSQTTLSVDETMVGVEQLKQRCPDLQAPPRDDICYATQNRQVAVKAMAPECDLVLVV